MSELQVLHNKAACLILDLPARSSGADALKRLGWKPILRTRKEHHVIDPIQIWLPLYYSFVRI